MTKSLIILILFLLTLSIDAQIISDRPDQTESSSTIERGNLQIESGLLLEYSNNIHINERHLIAPSTLFRYGLTKKIELRILSQFESILDINTTDYNNGISDIEIGTKIQLLKRQNINMEIAILSHLIIPTGSLNISNNSYSTINKLSISHRISESKGIAYNVGYNNFGNGKEFLTYSLAIGSVISELAALYIEIYGELSDIHKINFDAGFTYLIKNNLQFDFSFGTGLNHSTNYLSIGFSWQLIK